VSVQSPLSLSTTGRKRLAPILGLTDEFGRFCVDGTPVSTLTTAAGSTVAAPGAVPESDTGSDVPVVAAHDGSGSSRVRAVRPFRIVKSTSAGGHRHTMDSFEWRSIEEMIGGKKV